MFMTSHKLLAFFSKKPTTTKTKKKTQEDHRTMDNGQIIG